MANKNCRTKLVEVFSEDAFPKSSTNNILYQGESNSCIGVCTNSTLTSVLEVMLEDLCILNNYVDVEEYELCEEIKNELSREYNFKDLFQTLINRSCSQEQIKRD